MVASIIVELCKNYGARDARVGEFSKRAVINGKMDLSKAEAIVGMINAKSQDSLKLASKQLKGDLRVFVEKLRESLIEMLAFVEVCIDYAEDDLDSDIKEQIEKKLEKNIELLKNTLCISESRRGLLNGYKISIVGKPNVGKSSLLNSLLAYNRAIISDIEGTTRDTIEEEIKIGTHLVRVVDTAGIRDAKDEIEKIGINRSKEAIEESEIVLALFDGSREFSKDDEKIVEILKNFHDKKIFYIITKADLKRVFFNDFIEKNDPISLSKEDKALLIDRLREYLDTQSYEDDLILINQRQNDLVNDTLNALIDSKDDFKRGELELFAFNINIAIEKISSLTKPFERDEILDSMFSNFCLGK